MIRNHSSVTRTQKSNVVLQRSISKGEEAHDENTRLIQDTGSEALLFRGLRAFGA